MTDYRGIQRDYLRRVYLASLHSGDPVALRSGSAGLFFLLLLFPFESEEDVEITGPDLNTTDSLSDHSTPGRPNVCPKKWTTWFLVRLSQWFFFPFSIPPVVTVSGCPRFLAELYHGLLFSNFLWLCLKSNFGHAENVWRDVLWPIVWVPLWVMW